MLSMSYRYIENNTIKHSFGQQVTLKSYQVILETGVGGLKSVFLKSNVALFPNKMNVVPDLYLLCIICIYKTTAYFSPCLQNASAD